MVENPSIFLYFLRISDYYNSFEFLSHSLKYSKEKKARQKRHACSACLLVLAQAFFALNSWSNTRKITKNTQSKKLFVCAEIISAYQSELMS